MPKAPKDHTHKESRRGLPNPTRSTKPKKTNVKKANKDRNAEEDEIQSLREEIERMKSYEAALEIQLRIERAKSFDRAVRVYRSNPVCIFFV